MSNEQLQIFIQKEIASTLAPLMKRLEATEDLSKNAMSGFNQLTKIADHAMGNCASKDAHLKTLAADVLELNKNFNGIREALSAGKMAQSNGAVFSNTDLKRLAPARIQAASLQEIAEFCESGK